MVSRSKIIVIIFLIILTISVFLFYNKNTGREIYSQSRFFMDTLVTIKVREQSGAKEAVDRSFTVMQDWAEKLDRYEKKSIINDINTNGISGVQVSEEIMSLFTVADKYYQLSNGAFDITIAPLLDIWGFGQKEQKVPAEKQINSILPIVGLNKLVIDTNNNVIYLKEDMKIDMGGMAKGFVVDKGIESLSDYGIKSAFVNAGGNIRVLGPKYADRPWRIGIRKPRQKGDIYQEYIIGMKAGSVATSGDYERYFSYKGKRYSHLIDPRTGYQTREMQSVTVYAPDALTADILSTTIFIMGWEEGQQLVNNLSDIEAFMVKDEEDVWFSDGFKNLVSNQ